MPVSSTRNIGVVFDQEMTLVEHVITIWKTCFLHLRNIAKIRDSLSQKDTEILVHAFISSKLDSRNSLLYGLDLWLIVYKLSKTMLHALELVPGNMITSRQFSNSYTGFPCAAVSNTWYFC